MQRCPIAAKFAGSIGILPYCVLKDFLTNVCSRVTRSNKPCVISEDLNINIFNYASSSSQSFIDLLTSHYFLPTLIGNFCSNNILPIPKSGILISDISGHLPICMFTQSPSSSSPSTCNANSSFIRIAITFKHLMMICMLLIGMMICMLLIGMMICMLLIGMIICMLLIGMRFFAVMILKLHLIHLCVISIICMTKTLHLLDIITKPKPTIVQIHHGLLIHFLNPSTRTINYCQYLSNPTISHKNKYTKYTNILISLLRTSKNNYYARQFEHEKQ